MSQGGATARSDSRRELSHDARQLRQFIGWAAFPNFPFALALVGLWAVFPDPVVLGLAIATFVNGLVACIAWIEGGRDRVRASALWYAGGIWGLSFAIGLVGPQLFTIATILATLPVVVAVPYVSRRDLLLLAAITTGVVALDSVGFLYAPLAPQILPDGMVRLVVITGVVSLIGVLGLSLWHTRHTLDLVFDRMREANAALRESERSLEDKVRERTSELERSRRELALARDEAVAANRHKSAFLANMSHELRTPLNAIIGFSEVLLEKIFGSLEAKQEEYLRDVHESGKHLLSLINDILDLSKVEAGRLELSPSSFALPATIENVLVLMRERAARRGITLGIDLDPALGEVVLDERKVKQVLINLLSNAVKFTDEGGRVTTRARVRGDRVALCVEDTGIGIPPEERVLIFEEFRQGQASAQRKVEGTGLGLALTRRLVELHGGCIRVESEMGRGSVFYVDLPLRVLGGNTQEYRGGG